MKKWGNVFCLGSIFSSAGVLSARWIGDILSSILLLIGAVLMWRAIQLKKKDTTPRPLLPKDKRIGRFWLMVGAVAVGSFGSPFLNPDLFQQSSLPAVLVMSMSSFLILSGICYWGLFRSRKTQI